MAELIQTFYAHPTLLHGHKIHSHPLVEKNMAGRTPDSLRADPNRRSLPQQEIVSLCRRSFRWLGFFNSFSNPFAYAPRTISYRL